VTDHHTGAAALGFDSITVAAARRGDNQALGAIWRALNPKLVRLLRSLGAHEPDDIASQVWIEVARNLHRLADDPHEVRGLVFTIARRRCIDERRRMQRRPQRSLETVDDGESPLWQPIADIESSLDAEALLRRLDPAIAELIALRVIAGLSNAEIAKLTGKSEGAIRVATHRGLRQLQTLIESSKSPNISVTDAAPAAMDQL
jgi:RNA polymerase sigma-70 factor, ECF subfamily